MDLKLGDRKKLINYTKWIKFSKKFFMQHDVNLFTDCFYVWNRSTLLRDYFESFLFDTLEIYISESKIKLRIVQSLENHEGIL